MITKVREIEVNKESLPYASAALRCGFKERGFDEKEYILYGRANVYFHQGAGIGIKHKDVPYATRLIVRGPKDSARFSGNVVVEILNASARMDIDRMWVFGKEHFMRNGDVYIGITSKQDTLPALLAYDKERYQDITWASPVKRRVPADIPSDVMLPDDPDSETGLFWDMLHDLSDLLRGAYPCEGFSLYKNAKLVLTGWSQSACYLYRYLSSVLPYVKEKEGKDPFDGYMAAGGVHTKRVPLNQDGYYEESQNPKCTIVHIDRPFMDVQTESEHNWYDDLAERLEDSDKADFLYRGYDIAGASHDSVQTLLEYYKQDEGTRRIGMTPTYRGRHPYPNDFPTHLVFHALFKALFTWIREGKAPEKISRIELDENGCTKTDIHQNALGGVRTPFTDLATCSYHNFSRIGDEYERLFGHVEVLEACKIRDRYKDLTSYEKLVRENTDACIRLGTLLAEDREEAVSYALDAAKRRGL